VAFCIDVDRTPMAARTTTTRTALEITILMVPAITTIATARATEAVATGTMYVVFLLA
jgi:hypothetical protein